VSDADGVDSEDPESAVRALILRRLSGQMQTRKQLRDYLQRKNCDPEVVERLLDRFTDVGLINDADYAQAFVRTRRSVKGAGPSVLRRELAQRGVEPTLIEAAVDSREGDDTEIAHDLALRKVRSLQRFDPPTRVRRITAFLVRRGYAANVSFAIACEVSNTDPYESGDETLA